MIEYAGIPHRRWIGSKRRPHLSNPTKFYERVMREISLAIKRGDQVEMTHEIVNPVAAKGAAYDIISVRITK